MFNIHDNEIVSYKVDLKNQKITIHTEDNDLKLIKSTDIIFSDVLAHFFENQLNGSVIFDIGEYNINQFVNENSELLEKQKNYCWPIDYNTIEELTEKLLKDKYCYYVISSSYGLSGWVLAKNYEIINNNI
ncbi:hypothetical protein [Clostridium sp. ZBS13]|uniref:hypothetical protein n=1 Tax=Clostridium sp. ZBS13 TaxID=2949971 RepID=UPI002079483B